MSQVIRVEDKIYNDLDQLRVGRQTFGDVIEGLLLARVRVLEMMNVLEGSLGFREWQRQQLDKIANREER